MLPVGSVKPVAILMLVERKAAVPSLLGAFPIRVAASAELEMAEVLTRRATTPPF